jgi:hypothetical protein
MRGIRIDFKKRSKVPERRRVVGDIGRQDKYIYRGGANAESAAPKQFGSSRRAKPSLKYRVTILIQNRLANIWTKIKNDQKVSLPLIVLGLVVLALLLVVIRPGYAVKVQRGSEVVSATSLEDLKQVRSAMLSQGVKRRVYPLINQAKLTSDAIKSRPDIQSVRTEFIPLKGLTVTLVKFPVALALESSDELIKTTYVDTQGVVVETKEGGVTEQDQKNFPKVVDRGLEAAPLSVGKIALESQIVTYISTLESEYRRLNLPTRSYEMYSTDREVRVKFTDNDYYFKLSTTLSPRAQALNTQDVREYFAKSGKTAQEYVDIRLGEKAYYK